jgi:CubicO group peptidase (beta-lactamase class C family)
MTIDHTPRFLPAAATHRTLAMGFSSAVAFLVLLPMIATVSAQDEKPGAQPAEPTAQRSEPATTHAPSPEAPPAAEPGEHKPPEGAPAEVKPHESAPSVPVHRGPTSVEDLAAFVDGIMAIHLKDKHIAGATISVVVDSKPFFAKGYGYADVESKKPVSAEDTMFRIASVSKLFTWTAVMQLAEQGKLDLDADVNKYLTAFKVPETFSQPITLKDLMTHTPGFEDQVIGLFAHSPDKIEPLGEILARELPARVRAPGQLASYSNHGTALAGYIVAEVAGIPWEDYIEANILRPLGMHHTSVRQLAEKDLPADLSKGYKFQGGKFQEEGFEYVPAAPAGCMSSSAGDMAKFMIAHLQNGQYESARILNEDSAQKMRKTLFTHDARLEGMAYGFMRAKYNGETILHHGGDTFVFHSLFAMLPEHGVGFFVSYNTDTGGGPPRTELMEAFLDRYYPAPEKVAQPPLSDFSDRAARYTGDYGSTRHSHTSIAKIGALLNVVKVTADGDALVVKGGGPVPKRYLEVAPLEFREENGQDELLFREDENGRVTQLFSRNGVAGALVRLPWYETPMFTISLVSVCAGLFLSAIVGWPLAAFLSRGSPSRGNRTAVSFIVALLGWLTCVGIVTLVGLGATRLREPEEIAFGVPPAVANLLQATPIAAGLVAVMLIGAFVAWRNRYWRFSGRLHYTAVALAGVALVWFMHHWNLL